MNLGWRKNVQEVVKKPRDWDISTIQPKLTSLAVAIMCAANSKQEVMTQKARKPIIGITTFPTLFFYFLEKHIIAFIAL